MPAHDDEIALNVVAIRATRGSVAQRAKPNFANRSQARLVMRQRSARAKLLVRAGVRAAMRRLEQLRADTLLPEIVVDINAELDGDAVGGTRE